jgi:hypothetical protein
MTDFSDTPRQPRFVCLNDAVLYSPVGRSTLYTLAGIHPGLFRKHGKKIVVDLDLHDRLMSALPPAKIKQPKAA